jgi:hypothetical protein
LSAIVPRLFCRKARSAQADAMARPEGEGAAAPFSDARRAFQWVAWRYSAATTSVGPQPVSVGAFAIENATTLCAGRSDANATIFSQATGERVAARRLRSRSLRQHIT